MGGRAGSNVGIRAVREACDLDDPARRPGLGGGDVLWLGRSLLKCPKESPDGPREILISHLLSPHPHPTVLYGVLILFRPS